MNFQHHDTSYCVQPFVAHKIRVTIGYPAPTFRDIIKATAEVFDISAVRIVGNQRDRATCRARWAAMYIAWDMKAPSYPELGRAFGRDHTTCMHGVKKAKGIMDGAYEAAYRGEDFRAKIAQILAVLAV